MGKWQEKKADPKFQLLVRQHAATLALANALEKAMQRCGLTQAQLARKLGKSPAWISKLLHGGGNVTLFTAVEVAEAVGAEVLVSVEPQRAGEAGWLAQVLPLRDITFSNTNVGVATVSHGDAQFQWSDNFERTQAS